MVKTTRKQREALWRLNERRNGLGATITTYRYLRAAIEPYSDRSGCVMIYMWNMWLGIETDGYTHS